MKTQKTVNGSPPCKKRKLFDSLIGKDCSEIDPSYKLFLENLSIDGDTYELRMKKQKTVNGTPPCKKRKLFDSPIAKDDSEIEPSYKLYLENLRIDGDTYVLDMPNGDHGMPVSVRYEEDTSYVNVTGKNTTYGPNSSLVQSWGARKGKRIGEASGKAPKGKQIGEASFKAPKGKRIGEASGKAPKGKRIGEASGKAPKGNRKKKRKMKTSDMDESLALFLSRVQFQVDGTMYIEQEPGLTILFEQEEGMPSRYDEQLRAGSSTNGQQADKIASEDEMAGPYSKDLGCHQDIVCRDELGHVLNTESSDLNACDVDQGAKLALICSGSSTFDEKLSAILNQPYDQNEYEELWRKATDRKPISRQRQLRSGSKRYVTEAAGLSYLDHYPDLAAQIDSADRDERLNLLRKFFFWLENLCHEGAYMPWLPRPLACAPISPDEYEPTPRGEH